MLIVSLLLITTIIKNYFGNRGNLEKVVKETEDIKRVSNRSTASFLGVSYDRENMRKSGKMRLGDRNA